MNESDLNNGNNFGKGDFFEATLVLLVRDHKVWLAIKKKKIGAGQWNSWGGGRENGETIEAAAVRELREESGGKNDLSDPERGIRVREEDLEKVAIITFVTNKTDAPNFICEMHVYVGYEWEGEPEETDEMELPEWFNVDALPEYNMMAADVDWMPKILMDKSKFYATFQYNEDRTELIAEPQYMFVNGF